MDTVFPTYSSIDNNSISKIGDFNIIVNDVNYDYSGKQLAQCDLNGAGYFDMNTDGVIENCFIPEDGVWEVSIWLQDNAGNDTNIVVYAIRGESDPCARTIDTDWNISTVIDCNLSTTDLGTGRLIISPGGTLSLYDSNITTSQVEINRTGDSIFIYNNSFIRVE